MANLPITVQTDQLAGLEKAFDSVTKAVGGLSKVAPQLSKVLEQAANRAEKLSKANETQTQSVDRATKILERQKGILAEMSRDYTRGEASVLQYAKAAGATKTQLKELENTLKSIRAVMGTDPFDNSIGAIRRYQTENKVLAETFKSLKSGANLANSEIRDLIRIKEQATEAAKREGAAEQMTQTSIRNLIKLRVKEATDAYKEEIASNRELTKQITDYKNNLQRAAAVQQGFSAAMRGIVDQGLTNSFAALSNVSRGLSNAFEILTKAGKKVDDTLEQMEKQLRLMGAGFTKESAKSVIAFERQLVAAGKTGAEVGILTARYQGLLLRMQQVSAQNRRTANSFLGLQTILRQAFPAIGAVGLIATLTQLGSAAVRAADDMTLFRSRLQFVLQEGQSFDEVFKKLTGTANENRQALTDVVTLFNRISPSMNAAGRSTNEILTVVDSFSKTLLISGANTREASSAILQFSQAMAAGRLNGDEFRSITEAAPEFLRRFAQATGVAAESLKELSADGKLTSEVIADALIIMSESVKQASGSITINMAQAFQILKNNLTVTVDEVNQATGATQAMANVILDASDVVRGIGSAITYVIEEYGSFISASVRVASAIGITTGVYKLLTAQIVVNTATMVANRIAAIATGGSLGFVTAAANGALVAFRALTAAMLLNPFVLITAAVVGLTAAFVDLGFAQSDLTRKTEQLQNLQKMIPETTKKIIELEAKREQALSSGSLEKVNKIEAELARTRELLRVQTANQSNAQKELNGLTEEAGVSTKATAEEIENANRRIETWRQSITGASKSTSDLTKKNDELQFELDSVGKSTIEVAEARRILTLATAEQVELEGLMLLRSDKLSDKQAAEALELINRAEAMRLNADLEVRLAKARQAADLKLKNRNKLEDERNANLEFEKAVLEDLFSERRKNIDSIFKSAEATKKETQQLRDQTDQLTLSEELLREKEIATIDASLASAEAALSESLLSKTTDEVTLALQEQVANLRELKEAKRNLYNAEDNQKLKEEAKNVADKQAKEFEKIQDDIAKSITDAIIDGGKGGKEALKNIFEAQVFRIFVEPAIRGAVGSITNSLGLGSLSGDGSSGGSAGSLDIAGLANLASQSSTGGLAGVALNKGLEQLALNPQVLEKIGNSIFFNTTGALSDAGRSLATNASSLSSLAGEIAPYAGSIVAVLEGDLGSGLGSAAGTYIGGALGGPIGAAIGSAIGSALGGKLFGGGKISATTLSPEFGAGVRETLEEQYLNIVRGLGGVAANVTFSAFGNTGRQGQNPNFTLGASVNGANVFGSAQTAEGQRDGLFLSGEIALNEVNLSDQSTRAIIAVLKETEFKAEINALFDSVNAATDSIDRLNDVLKQVEIVKFLSRNLTVFSANIRDLITTSADAFNKLVEMSGGTDAFAQALDLYVNTFATDTEKLANAQKVVADAFDTLNITVPETQKELRALIDAQDLTTEAGRRAYLSLIGLIPAFTEVTNISNQFKAAQERLSQTISDSVFNIQTSFGNFLTLIQSRADSLEAGGFTSSVDAIEQQIAQLQASVDIVDFSSFTRQMGVVSNNIATLTSEIANTTDVGTRLILEDQLQQSILARYQLEQELLGNVFATIQETLKAITGERVAVRNAASQILGGPRVLNPTEIRSRISSISATSSLPELDMSQVTPLTNTLSGLQSQIAPKLITQSQQSTLVANAQASYRDILARIFGSEGAPMFQIQGAYLNSELREMADGTVKGFYSYFLAYNTAQQKELTDKILVGGPNGLISVIGRLAKATNDFRKTSKEVEALGLQIKNTETLLEEARASAQQKFAEEIQRFVIDAGKAVNQLGKLREETVRYFEDQKRLAGEMISASSNIRQTISNIRFADLAPQEQLQNLQDQFSKLFNQSIGLEGAELANVGNNLNSLIDPILQKAQELFASGPQFQAIKEALLAQASEVATKIEMLTPVNYQQESLDLLDTIDTTLALIEENTKSAEQLIVDAIGSSADRTVQALAQIYSGITGESLPSFQQGGYHFGGSAIVGEQGRELVNMGNARVFNASQTAQMLAPRVVDMSPVVNAINSLEQRMDFQTKVQQEGFRRLDEKQTVMADELTDIRKKAVFTEK